MTAILRLSKLKVTLRTAAKKMNQVPLCAGSPKSAETPLLTPKPSSVVDLLDLGLKPALRALQFGHLETVKPGEILDF